MDKTMGNFKLHIERGSFRTSNIIVLLGQNGTGKTTFIRMLAGAIEADNAVALPQLSVSFKPQMITAKFTGTVDELFNNRIRESYHHPQFINDCVKPMDIERIKDLKVQDLSAVCCGLSHALSFSDCIRSTCQNL